MSGNLQLMLRGSCLSMPVCKVAPVLTGDFFVGGYGSWTDGTWVGSPSPTTSLNNMQCSTDLINWDFCNPFFLNPFQQGWAGVYIKHAITGSNSVGSVVAWSEPRQVL